MRKALDPHFAANVVCALIGLSREGDRARLEESLRAAGRLVRSLEQEGGLAPLRDEIAFIEAWLELQGLRFDPRLAFSIESDARSRDVRFPRFLLFELVADAVENRIEPVTERGRIEVRCRSRETGELAMTLSDSGPAPGEPFCAALESSARACRRRLARWSRSSSLKVVWSADRRERTVEISVTEVTNPLSEARPH